MRQTLSVLLVVLFVINCTEDNPIKTPIVEPLISEGVYKGYFGYNDYINPDSIYWNLSTVEFTFSKSEYVLKLGDGNSSLCPGLIDGDYFCDDTIIFLNDTTNYLLNTLCAWEVYRHRGDYNLSKQNDSILLVGLDSISSLGLYFQITDSK